MDDMADFMADDGDELVVRHEIHQAGVHAHRTVAAGEGVDLVGLVDLVVEGHAVDLVDARHQPAEAGDVCPVVNGVLLVQLGDGLAAELHDLRVGDGHGRDGLAGGGGDALSVPVYTRQKAAAGE